jgi:flagellar basal-body rod protein FlgF
MTDPVTAMAGAMRADAEMLRSISQNVANAQTPAYRREVPLVYSSLDGMTASDAERTATLDVQTAIDLRPGTLQRTGEPLNLAIEGAAFFVVGTEQGERLTRRGDFHLSAEGSLVTASGDPVLGATGPLQINGGSPAISADGTVRVDGASIGKLRIVEIENAAALQAAGNGLYALAEGEEPLESSAQVRQGFLETSNVSSVDEMLSLMETMRRFETAQRFVRAYDSMVDNAITTLGKV